MTPSGWRKRSFLEGTSGIQLNGEEKAELYKPFRELSVVTEGMHKEWEEYAVAIPPKLYNTSWSFKNIVLRIVSKVQRVKTQPLN